MINIEQLRAAYAEKLTRTGSMDAAFVKAVWLAYKAGLADAPQVTDKKPCVHIPMQTGMYEPFDTACEKCGAFMEGDL